MPQPIIVSTWSFAARGNDAAWPDLAAGGSSLDAVEHVCRVVEDDPAVDSVGYGGLPDRDGHVTLDGSVMLAPNRCGSVCALRRHRHPVSVARLVMERTSHVMLAGPDADDFADAEGLAGEPMLSPEAAAHWEEWKRHPRVVDQSRDAGRVGPRPVDTGRGGALFARPAGGSPPETDETRWRGHDTVCAMALDEAGVLAGGCSTSGTPFKRPGRVGDSPIIGHGLYVDPAQGGASATGTGELIMGVSSSFQAVEEMRRGASPLAALAACIERVHGSFDLRTEDQVAMIALRPDGAWASAALRGGYKTVITTAGAGTRVEDAGFVLLPD